MANEILDVIEAYLVEHGYCVDGWRGSKTDPFLSPAVEHGQIYVHVEGWDNLVVIDIWDDNIQIYQQRRRKEYEATVSLHDPDMFDLLLAAIPASPSYD